MCVLVCYTSLTSVIFQVNIPHDVYQNKRILSTLRSIYDEGKKKPGVVPPI